jgi:hypothetical protein
MRKPLVLGIALLVTSVVVLGSTVFRQQVADASSLLNVFVTNDSSHPVPVREQNTDANGNIKVHEQSTANINVTNTSAIPVHEQGTANASITAFPQATTVHEDGAQLSGGSQKVDTFATINASTIVLMAAESTADFEVAAPTGFVEFFEIVPSGSTVTIPLNETVPVDEIIAGCNSDCRVDWTLVGN